MDFAVTIPPDMVPVIQDVTSKDWLITYYDASKEDLYNPANYLRKIHVEKCDSGLVLDRNVFSYIISSVTKNKASRGPMDDLARSAIGLMLFCRFSEILIEPNLALYEVVNHDAGNIEIALDELEIFRTVDNLSASVLMDFYIGRIDSIPILDKVEIEREKIKGHILEFEWLKEWRSLYLIALKIVDLDSMDDKTNEEKLEELLTWMSKKYRLSHVSIVFAIYLFSSKRISKMVKYKNTNDKKKRYLALKNMTWDLYFMNSYIRRLNEKKENIEYLVATSDKVIKEVLTTSIAIALPGNEELLKDYLTSKEYSNVQKLFEFVKSNEERKYQSSEWTEEYRERLIFELEQKLLI